MAPSGGQRVNRIRILLNVHTLLWPSFLMPLLIDCYSLPARLPRGKHCLIPLYLLRALAMLCSLYPTGFLDSLL